MAKFKSYFLFLPQPHYYYLLLHEQSSISATTKKIMEKQIRFNAKKHTSTENTKLADALKKTIRPVCQKIKTATPSKTRRFLDDRFAKAMDAGDSETIFELYKLGLYGRDK